VRCIYEPGDTIGADDFLFRRKNMVTLYDTLGVREDASNDEIKRAYRKAAMRAHPDRNQGREAAAHDAFQEIKQAYAILSDPEQRRVYDEVFAEEMGKLREREKRQARAVRERAEREARVERMRYEKFVAKAIRYAERGHNRDVVFGVLLGRGCDEGLAARIADSVAAFSAARAQAAPARDAGGVSRADDATRATDPARGEGAEHAPASPHRAPEAEPVRSETAAHAGLFATLWQGVFGVRS
jgi:curved DNA-binding protein CbpA